MINLLMIVVYFPLPQGLLVSTLLFPLRILNAVHRGALVIFSRLIVNMSLDSFPGILNKNDW